MKTKTVRKSIALIAVAALMCLAATLFAFGHKVTAHAEGTDAVDIPDRTLKQQIIDTLELSTDTITQNDMARLTTLETPQNDPAKMITDLTGLEYAVNLRVLDLDYNKITDLTPIAGLTKLETLDISYNNGAVSGTNGITDISYLSGLTALKSFSCIGNDGIQDFSVLNNFTGLTYLNLALCGMTDIAFVKSMPGLEKLYLSFNAISDIYPVAGLTSLQTLALGNNKVADIAPLASLASLTQLTLENNYIDDFAAVLGLTSLQKLDVSRNFLTMEQTLEIMENIQGDVIVSPSADETQKSKAFTLPAKEYTLRPNGTQSIAVSGASYYSTDPNVATVADGTVTAKAAGKCHIVVVKDGFARGVAVTVEGSPEKPKKKGCGCGSTVAAASSALAGGCALIFAAAVAVSRKKKGARHDESK